MIIGSDRNANVIEQAKANALKSGVGSYIQLEVNAK
jgi:23S rRNA G2445 N2-methylase RlmL